MEQATQGSAQQHHSRNQGRHALLSILPAHLHSTRGPPSSQGQQEKEVQKTTRQVVECRLSWDTDAIGFLQGQRLSILKSWAWGGLLGT